MTLSVTVDLGTLLITAITICVGIYQLVKSFYDWLYDLLPFKVVVLAGGIGLAACSYVIIVMAPKTYRMPELMPYLQVSTYWLSVCAVVFVGIAVFLMIAEALYHYQTRTRVTFYPYGTGPQDILG